MLIFTSVVPEGATRRLFAVVLNSAPVPPSPLDVLLGARIQGAALVPETGLLVLTVFGDGVERRLGIGLGPRVVGIGFLPRSPAFGAPSTHPLLSAIRAHLVGHRIRSLVEDDGELWMAAGGEGAISRLALAPALRGEARVLDIAVQTVIRWAPSKPSPFRPVEPEADEALEDAGLLLVDASDRLAAEAARRALLATVRAHVKRLSRRADAVRSDLARLEDAPRLQRIGRMLLAQAESIPRGATDALLEDWELGGLLEVKLDPALPPRAQAPRYFERAKKLVRGEAIMRERLETTEEALERARDLEASVLEAEDIEASTIADWSKRAKELGARRGQSPAEQPRRGKKEEPRLPYSLYRGHRGARILVGRGAKDNDALTLRIAKPHDLWLHARGVPGAHVVVPLSKGASCPSELLVDAALLAAHHSEARGENPVEIAYTERRHVRKRKGTPPGQVLLDREKVLLLRVDSARLARLLATREE